MTGGDDPALDLLLGWLALETGARRGDTRRTGAAHGSELRRW